MHKSLKVICFRLKCSNTKVLLINYREFNLNMDGRRKLSNFRAVNWRTVKDDHSSSRLYVYVYCTKSQQI